ncbi:DUF4158 domain-containing protein [Streptomyces sp. NPDC060064]|uniref:DUF4158 domain-containing protein n=1 Tax=Streptomyces sp. NPDC060064 TaxID=3347049 RepID=UPI0036D0A0D2
MEAVRRPAGRGHAAAAQGAAGHPDGQGGGRPRLDPPGGLTPTAALRTKARHRFTPVAGLSRLRAVRPRLGFALLLKFFEVEARFPETAQEVSAAAVDYVAQQVKVPAVAWADHIGRVAAGRDGDRGTRHRRRHIPSLPPSCVPAVRRRLGECAYQWGRAVRAPDQGPLDGRGIVEG